jgi:mannosyl-3-phosphoglycerate phosphatase
MKSYVIFTDLDGTLLDHQTYDFAPAVPALCLIGERGIPLVICSSKTRSEIERYRERLENRHPFITENGGAIFIPKGYFSHLTPPTGFDLSNEGDYEVITLGASYGELRRAVQELRSEGFEITGFGDMTAEGVAAVSGLTVEQAALAKEREFDEPFLFEGNEGDESALGEAIRAKGFNLTQGRFFHILGESDKGKAVTIVSDLYRQIYGEICTVALGDSLNDLPMLERADCPVLVKKPDGRHDTRIRVPHLRRADGIGPVGWNRALIELLRNDSA